MSWPFGLVFFMLDFLSLLFWVVEMKVTDNHCEMKNNFWRVSLASLREARGQAGIPGVGGIPDALDAEALEPPRVHDAFPRQRGLTTGH